MAATFEGIFTVIDEDTKQAQPSEQDKAGIMAWIRAKWQWCCRNWTLLAGCTLGIVFAAAFYTLLGSIVAMLFGVSVTAGATYGAIAGVASGVWSMFSNRELIKAAVR